MALEEMTVASEQPAVRTGASRRRQRKAAADDAGTAGSQALACRSAAQQPARAGSPVGDRHAPGEPGSSSGKLDPRPRRPARAAAAEHPARPKGSEHRFEVFGVGILAFALLLFLGLISYDAADISPGGGASTTGETVNLIGPVGAYLADLQLYLLGGGAFLFTLSLGLVGAVLFFNRRVVLGLAQVVGFVLFAFCSTVLVHLHFRGQRLMGHLPGGVLGELLGEVGRSMLGTVGTAVLCWTLGLIAVMLVTRFSLARSLTWLGVRGARLLRLGLERGWSCCTAARASLAGALASRRREAEVEPPPLPLPEPDGDDLIEIGEPDEEWTIDDPHPAAGEAHPDWSFGDDEPGAVPEGPRGTSEVVFFEPFLPERTPRPEESSGPSGALAEDGTEELADHAAGEQEGTLAAGETADALPQPPREQRGGASRRSETLPYPGDGRRRSGDSGRSGSPAIIQPLAATRELPLDIIAGLENDRITGPRPAWDLPPLSLLDYTPRGTQDVDRQALLEMAGKLEGKLANYGVKGKVREIHPGPVVTMFEFEPGPGIRISKIANLCDDLAMSLEAVRVRIVAPIPGKGVVGIEVPSQRRETVYLKELIADESFQKSRMRLPLCLGKDIIGYPVVRDLAKMPHLLTAGATGSGKSVLVNAMVVSLLYRYSPEELRLIMVDPKQLEFALYEGIPHLLLPVVTDPKKAAAALKWAVAEMERRYSLLAEVGVRQLSDYNRWVEARQAELANRGRARRGIVPGEGPDDEGLPEPEIPQKLPSVVVIIDEFAELMMVCSKDVETAVCRLAQKARASGIHLILATQRPSVDVITGVIKANFPARIGLQVAQREDSRTILGQNGAENLLGDGDMLIMSPGTSGLSRAHGPLVTDEEIRRVCDHWRDQGTPRYDMDILTQQEKEGEDGEVEEDEANLDEMYDMAVHVVAEARLASASMLQRRLRIGYNRAARLIEIMEREGVVGPPDGARPREVLVPPPMDL